MARIALVTEKVHSEHSGDFSETVDFAVLHCANVTGNNNKFYCIELQKNPTTGHFRLFSNYGRLEVSEIFEVRQKDKNGDALDEDRCRVEYDKLVKKKQKGKNVVRDGETIRECYTRVDVVSPTVGSSNIRHSSSVQVKNTSAPVVRTDDRDPESSRLISLMVRENIHNITSNTTIRFTSNGFETSLGPVTEPHLDKATTALDALRDEMNGNTRLDDSDSTIRDANSAYFSLIPRKFGSRISSSDMILTPDKLAEEYDLLDNLRTAVQAGLNATDDDGNDSRVSINLNVLNRVDTEFQRLNDMFENTKHRNHAEGRYYHIRNIYTLDIPSVTSRYEPVAKKLGNIRELFHGTRTANMLSISLKGLIIPPTGAAHVTGRMFGNGVYAASCSTKALNYAIGYWSGGYGSNRTAFMLMVNFAMGKEYVATSHRYSGAPKGYDSVWGKAGHSLLNDEYIVYNLNQATITHVLELEK